MSEKTYKINIVSHKVTSNKIALAFAIKSCFENKKYSAETNLEILSKEYSAQTGTSINIEIIPVAVENSNLGIYIHPDNAFTTHQKCQRQWLRSTNLILYCIDLSSDVQPQEIEENISQLHRFIDEKNAQIFLVGTFKSSGNITENEIKALEDKIKALNGIAEKLPISLMSKAFFVPIATNQSNEIKNLSFSIKKILDITIFEQAIDFADDLDNLIRQKLTTVDRELSRYKISIADKYEIMKNIRVLLRQLQQYKEKTLAGEFCAPAAYEAIKQFNKNTINKLPYARCRYNLDDKFAATASALAAVIAAIMIPITLGALSVMPFFPIAMAVTALAMGLAFTAIALQSQKTPVQIALEKFSDASQKFVTSQEKERYKPSFFHRLRFCSPCTEQNSQSEQNDHQTTAPQNT